MAKSHTVEVKTKEDGKLIGTCTFPEFETIDEAVAELGTEKLLAKLNAKVKSDTVNSVRVAHSQNTPEKQIARLMRDKRKGKVSAADAREQVAALLAELAG